MTNKKGVSEMVSYVILIVISVGLSIAVYSFLKLYAGPSTQAPPCPEAVHLIIENAECTFAPGASTLELTITNKGLFSVDYIFIKMAPPDRTISESLNPGGEKLGSSLDPQKSTPPTIYNTSIVHKIIDGAGEYTLEIQPAINTPQGKSVCENAIVTQTVTCKV